MAAPTVRNVAAATNATDSLPAFALTLPTRVAGDVLLAFVAGDYTTAVTPTGTWSELSDEAGTNNRLALYARIATNDANDALSVAGANNQDSSANVVSIQDHGVTDVTTDIVLVAAATGNDTNADPPSIDGGSAKDWMAVAIAAVDLTGTGSSITDAPTNYTTGAILQKSASSTSSVALGVGFRGLSAAQTENPGTFTNTTGQWVAKTILVPPVVPPSTEPVVPKMATRVPA